ncbi:MAG: hypothetical protein R2857_08835 [Vampirovibrionales bacterium]
MNTNCLRIWRNLFLRAFLVGVGLTVLLAIAIFLPWDAWMPYATSMTRLTEAQLAPKITQLFLDIRYYLLFIVLTPGLALHWTLKKEEATAA